MPTSLQFRTNTLKIEYSSEFSLIFIFTICRPFERHATMWKQRLRTVCHFDQWQISPNEHCDADDLTISEFPRFLWKIQPNDDFDICSDEVSDHRRSPGQDLWDDAWDLSMRKNLPVGRRWSKILFSAFLTFSGHSHFQDADREVKENACLH